MPRRLLGSSFIARPMRIIQQRGNETRFGNKMSRETGTRRGNVQRWRNKGNFLRTWTERSSPNCTPLTVHEILGKLIRTHGYKFPESVASKFETERVETQQHSTRQFSKLPTNFSCSLLRSSSSFFSSPIRAVQRIIPTFNQPFSFFFLQIFLPPSDSSWAQRSTSPN